MGYTMATAVCDRCGARHRISEKHGIYKPGTTVSMWCACAETPDDRFAHTPHTITDGNDGPAKRPMVTAICCDCGHKRRVSQQRKKHSLGDRLNIPCRNKDSDHKLKSRVHIVVNDTDKVTMRCNDCGHKVQLIKPAKPHASGTKISYICWACPERNVNGWAILHQHTVMPKNEDPTYQLMTAACGECGYERCFMDAYECEPGTKLTLECHNRDAGHLWKNQTHTVVAAGATA